MSKKNIATGKTIVILSCCVIFFVFFSYSQQDVSGFKKVFSECGLKWKLEVHFPETNTYTFLLDSIGNTRKEVIRLALIQDISIVGDRDALNDYIIGLYYSDEEILSSILRVVLEKTGLVASIYVTTNSGDNPKKDLHVILKICEEYYLMSYFAYMGVSQVNMERYQCVGQFYRHFVCMEKS
ncbi:MAG: hypothetical protein AAF348_19650 [Bacteroidota bacterium]